MAPKNSSTSTDSGLSSALQLKQKLLARQKSLNPSNNKTMASAREKLHEQERRRREKRKASNVELVSKSGGKKSKRRKQEKDEDEEEESEKESDESDDEVSVMDMMRRQFEMQFGKVAGVTDPIKKNKKQIKEKKSGKTKKAKKISEEPTKKKIEEEDEWDIEIPQHGHAFESMFHEFDSECEQEEEQEQEQQNHLSSEDEAPVVVRYTDAGRSLPRLGTSKREKKLFMSSKAPASVVQRLAEEKAAASAAAAEPDENEEDKILTQEDLKNDLELQRLLRESHILADAASQGKLSGYDISSAYDVEGRNGKMSAITGGSPGVGGLFGQARVQTMEMRMDLLGMKKKRERAVNMKVLQSRAAERKKERRRQIDEAREAGIILPTNVLNGPEPKKKKSADRGLKIQLVGKHTKHGLNISKKEIESVSGTSRD